MPRPTLLLAALVLSLAATASAQDAPRKVSGRVFDDSTGCPLHGAQVTINGSATHTATDANGRYRLVDPPTGPLSLRTTLAGYQPQQVDGVVVSDSLSRVDFTLPRTFRDGSVQTAYPKAACHLAPRDST
jgi:hypothetical protein